MTSLNVCLLWNKTDKKRQILKLEKLQVEDGCSFLQLDLKIDLIDLLFVT